MPALFSRHQRGGEGAGWGTLWQFIARDTRLTLLHSEKSLVGGVGAYYSSYRCCAVNTAAQRLKLLLQQCLLWRRALNFKGKLNRRKIQSRGLSQTLKPAQQEGLPGLSGSPDTNKAQKLGTAPIKFQSRIHRHTSIHGLVCLYACPEIKFRRIR